MKGRVLAGVVVCACVVPAAASSSVRTETVDVGQRVVVSATAECPEGERATGGGWQSSPTVSEDVQVYPMESRKVGQSKWRVTGAQNSPNEDVEATMTAIVYCSKNAPKTNQEQAQVAVGDDEVFANVDARCGQGEEVQSGGFDAPTNTDFDPFTSVLENFRVRDSKWRVRAYGYGEPLIRSYAYCAPRQAPEARSGNPSVVSEPLDQTDTTSKRCEDGSIAAGGFKQTDEAINGSYDTFEGFYESYRDDDRWVVAGSYYGTNENSLISIAYCD